MVRTLEDALELIRDRGVVSEVPTHGLTSLVEMVIGGMPEGSWREHAKGRLIYRLGRQLRASPEVLALRLVEGKVAFVDPSLWETVYCVVMHPERRRRALDGLSAQARALLGTVERDGSVQLAKTGDWTKAREALEERLLVHSSETEDERGEHVVVLRSWRAWASEGMKDACGRTTYADALRALERACGGAPASGQSCPPVAPPGSVRGSSDEGPRDTVASRPAGVITARMSTTPATAARPNLRKFPIRRLLALAATEKRNLVLGTLCLALASGMSLVFPQAIRVIVDGALGNGDRAAIDRTALWMVAIFAVQGAAMAMRYVLFTISGERIVSRLREQLYRSLVNQEIGFFDERRTGELVSRLASDTTVLQNTVSANVSMVLRNLAATVGGVALLFWTSPKLTLLMLAVVPPVALAAVLYGKRVRKLSKALQDSLAATSEVAEETLSGIRTVRAFAAEATEAARYGTAVERAFQLARKRAFVAGSFFGGASFFAYGAAAVVLWSGSRMVMDGVLTIGELTSFLMYTLIVAFSLGALGELWTDFMKAVGAGERVFELLDRAPAIPTSGGGTLPSVRGEVAFEDVRFSYPTRPDVPVLRGIDLHVRPGELVAVVGSSGAGKSTLAALLGRLYDPQEGRIHIDGVPLKELDPSWLRRQIGVVAQEPILFSTTVAENIRYGRTDATDAEVEAAARTANAHDFVTKFPEGYKTMVGERGVQLSGGQKQRVAIARAVLKDPRILVLDEATSALDAESEHLVKEALDRLLVGRTTLVIAHRLSTVADADRVVVLDGGRIVQSGAHQELLREEGLYKRLVERQFVAA